jgi:hypothetical protein
MTRQLLAYCLFTTVGLIAIFCSSPTDPFLKPFKIAYETSEKVFTEGIAAPSDIPALGGEQPISLRISPNLPLGLEFDTANGLISGTPLDTMSRKAFSVTALNRHGSYSVSINITVNPSAPLTLVYDLDSATYKIGVPIFENNPSFTGGAPTQYASDKPFPDGIRLDAIKGTLYGTPTRITPLTSYTITGSNPSGSASATIRIAIDSTAAVDTAVSRPSRAQALRIDTQLVRVWWNKVTGADSYLINRSLASDSAGFHLVTTVSDTFYTDTSRINGYYFINARRGAYTSGGSDTVATLDTLNITPVNRLPSITSSLAGRSIKVNESDTITITAADADTGQTLSMKLVNLDSLRALFGADSLTAIIWTPGATSGKIVFSPRDRSGTYRFTVRVSDGIDSVFGTITVYVGNVNRAPEWVTDTIKAAVNDNASFSFSLSDSCDDRDAADELAYRYISDSLRSSIAGGRFSFSAGTLDTLLRRVVAIEASDGRLSDTLYLQITIVPVNFSLTTSAQNGSVTVYPDRTSFRMGESVRLTGVPSSGYGFVRWSGDIDTIANPVTIKMDRAKAVTANFRRYIESECVPLAPGVSINAKIEELSALPGGGSTICPAQGKYDSGTIEVEGKVTVQVKGTLN